LGLDNLMVGGRRRSASESDGNVMSSTLNPNEPRQVNIRYSYRSNGTYASNPHINLSRFIDDSYRDNIGTRLQTRIQTRFQGDSSAIEKLRSDYLKYKAETEEWGAIVSNSCQFLWSLLRINVAGFVRIISNAFPGFF